MRWRGHAILRDRREQICSVVVISGGRSSELNLHDGLRGAA